MPSSPLRRALARARSAELPGPVFTAAAFGAVPARPGGPIAVPPALDRPLALSLAGDRLRPVPSAGALHPVEPRLLLGEGHPYGIAPGHYAYDPRRHRLHRLGPAPDPAPRNAFLVLGARPERTVSHYGHRGWPLVLLDVGHAAAGVLAAWPGPEPVEATLGVGPVEGMDFPLAGVRLAGGGGTGEWAGSGAPPEPPAAGVPADLAEARRVLGELARAEDGGWSAPGPGRTDPAPLLRRRSADPARIGSGAPPPDPAALLRVLQAAESACRSQGPRWCLAVGGTRPGLLRAERGTAATLATGHVLPTLAAWAAGQGWIAGAGAVLLAYGCPSDAAPGRVRRDHLLAGYGVGHAQIEATALGLASRPVGSWQHADLGAALGGEPGREWILHGLALGSASEAPPARRASPGHRRWECPRRGQEEDLQVRTPSPAGVPPAGEGGGPSALLSVADGLLGPAARAGVTPVEPGGGPPALSLVADGLLGPAARAAVPPAEPGGGPPACRLSSSAALRARPGRPPVLSSVAHGPPGPGGRVGVPPAEPGGRTPPACRLSSSAALRARPGRPPALSSVAHGPPGLAAGSGSTPTASTLPLGFAREGVPPAPPCDPGEHRTPPDPPPGPRGLGGPSPRADDATSKTLPLGLARVGVPPAGPEECPRPPPRDPGALPLGLRPRENPLPGEARAQHRTPP
ncbi:hypothetical protein GCM10010387_62570 [Streptomyces inusitatus]|uniref:Nitroreductase n=1 Tax=Streptomyces inusitatus TaxID=68221 RepID=A0A918QMT6_9ACTN|nr:hypothetical protein [Streptomyces inusitatus]GGZ60360.1 hypothetical protein GCM10010387_62570 [Streptomyces inusitatus]